MGIKEQTGDIDVSTGYYMASIKHGATIYYYKLDKIYPSFLEEKTYSSINNKIEDAKVAIGESISPYR
jgi:hypothetical protein